jgi:hypothetical protein
MYWWRRGESDKIQLIINPIIGSLNLQNILTFKGLYTTLVFTYELMH